MGYHVLLYYWFCQINDPEAFAHEHRALCERLELRGRVLIANEGINGSVSGTPEACLAYQSALLADGRFTGMEFKVEESDGHTFKGMHVRIRPEIITLGMPLATPIQERTGIHLSPVEWREKMNEDNVILLDGRNGYESTVGRFKGAICPPIENFRELPAWLETHRNELLGKQILTYCTGGIRCEKLSTWMLSNGFENVYQLHGGIVSYAQHPETEGEGFEGVNVVFDDRVVSSAGPKAKPLTRCRECGELCANYVNCANVLCNDRMIMCPSCEALTERCCSDACRTSDSKREKGQKLRA
jgi:UPF0176 protein